MRLGSSIVTALATVGVAAASLTVAAGQITRAATSDLPAPVQLTREQGHQRLMDLLHIGELRRGPDGDPTSPNAANFDESSASDLGLFEGQSDIGDVTPPGSGRYSATAGAYTLTSAGSNTWYHVDNFHYLWKKASGDVSLTANVTFPPPSYQHEPNPQSKCSEGNPAKRHRRDVGHRKGILMFRQTLDAGGIYAGVGVHGSGMTALQYRRALGANTEDIELNIDSPQTVRVEKRGDTFTLFLSMKGERPHQVGASVTPRVLRRNPNEGRRNSCRVSECGVGSRRGSGPGASGEPCLCSPGARSKRHHVLPPTHHRRLPYCRLRGRASEIRTLLRA